jgi:hypothetical protein
MELFRQIEAAVLAAKSSTGRRWDGRDFGDGTVPRRRLWAERAHSCCADGGYQFAGRISARVIRRLQTRKSRVTPSANPPYVLNVGSMTEERNAADMLGEALVEKCQKIQQREALIWSH